MPGINFNIPY